MISFTTDGEYDYTYIIFGGDICYVIAAIAIFFVNVSMEDVKKESMFKSFKKIISWPAVIFFSMVFFRGINMAIDQTYRTIYLQEDLGAPPELIGN